MVVTLSPSSRHRCPSRWHCGPRSSRRTRSIASTVTCFGGTGGCSSSSGGRPARRACVRAGAAGGAQAVLSFSLSLSVTSVILQTQHLLEGLFHGEEGVAAQHPAVLGEF